MPDEKVIDLDRLSRFHDNLKSIGLPLNNWQANKKYKVGYTVIQNGKFYRCKTEHTSTTTFDATKFDLVGGSGNGNGLNDWSANTQYKIDSIVVNDGQIYKSLVEFTSGSTFENIQILDDYVLQTGDTPILWASGIGINTNDIVEYNSNYYKALYNFTCGSTFTKNVFEEYVPKSLTDAEVKEVIDSYTPEFNGGIGVENYSTEERRVGTWIDGKPLYQKTIVDTMPTVTTQGTRATKTINISFIGIKKVINFSSIQLTSSGEYIPTNSVNLIGPSNSFSIISFYNSQSDINGVIDSIFLGSTRTADSGRPVYITVQYTKTTN